MKKYIALNVSTCMGDLDPVGIAGIVEANSIEEACKALREKLENTLSAEKDLEFLDQYVKGDKAMMGIGEENIAVIVPEDDEWYNMFLNFKYGNLSPEVREKLLKLVQSIDELDVVDECRCCCERE